MCGDLSFRSARATIRDEARGFLLWESERSRSTTHVREEGGAMASKDKGAKNTKTAGKSLKEKRQAKKAKAARNTTTNSTSTIK
jgi:hypothetical protein